VTNQDLNTGARSDAEAQAKAIAARGRPAGEPEPIGDSIAEVMGAVARAKDAHDRKKLSVLQANCPKCELPDCETARFCNFRGEKECKHTDALKVRGKIKTRETNLRNGKVPSKHWEPILSNDIDELTPVAAVYRALAGEMDLVILAGGPDSGKSFAAALAIAERGGFWVNAEVFDQFPSEIKPLLHHCREAPLLVVDDVGAGRSTSQVAAPQIEGLIRERFDRELITIQTTNLTKAEFWPFYGGECGRMANRLGPNGWVRCLDTARRRNGRGEK
jgi:hypothetical protein